MPTPSTPTPEPTPTPISYLTATAADLASPSAFNGAAAPTVNVFDRRQTISGHKLQVLSTDLCLAPAALAAFDQLNADLGEAFPGWSLLVVCCCTSDASTLRCGQPEALREHASGYAADLWFYYKASGKSAVGYQLSEAPEQAAFLLTRAAQLGIVQSRTALSPAVAERSRHFLFVLLDGTINKPDDTQDANTKYEPVKPDKFFCVPIHNVILLLII